MRLRVLPSFVLFATLFLIPLMHADSIVIVGDKLAPDGSFVSVTLVPGVYQLLVGRRYPPLTFLGFSEIFKGPAETTVLTYTLTLANLASPLVRNFRQEGRVLRATRAF